MSIRAVYRCKLCGKRVYTETALRSDRDLTHTLHKVMDNEEIDYSMIPDQVVHSCDENKAGIAKLIGLKRWE